MLNSKVCVPLIVCVIIFNVVLPCQGQFYPSSSGSAMAQAQSSGMGGMDGGAEAFMSLLAPIETPLFPPNLMAIKNKLCELVMSQQLEVAPVLEYLVRFQHMDKFDFMIAALLALRDTLPGDCPLRQELSQLIVHSIFKRCQLRLGGGGSGSGSSFILSPAPPPPPPPPPAPQPQLSCETIINVLNYFQNLYEQCGCQDTCTSCGSGFAPSSSGYGPSGGQYKRNSQQINRRRSVNLNRGSFVTNQVHYSNSLPYEQLLANLPQPQNSIERVKYDTVKNFLRSSEITKYIAGIKASDYSNKQTLLNLVLYKVAESNVTASIKEAFNYYLRMSRSTNTVFDYSTLVDLLPQPLDQEEKTKFELVKSFLSSKEVHKYLKNINAASYSNRKLLIKTVLKTLAASKLEAKTVEAFEYYSNYQDSLTELELYTKKEITKHFELTKIFIDTLDIESLSTDAKLSFKKFFKFISNVTKDQIKSFDGWSEVKTKGEFMKALFKFLLSQSFVPQEIKDSIVKLEPLVKMVGRGAAPP